MVADAATPVEAAYQAPKDETHSLIGRLETNQLRNLLTTVLREGKRDFYPVDEGMVVEPQASTDVSIGGRDIIAVPAFVRFTQNANTYCNLVVLHRETGRAELVAEPDAFACRGIQEAAKLDLNGDGVVDFIYLVDMPSNRANVIMSVPAVYLSNVRDATYCYGSNASEALMIAGANRSSFKKTIESDVRRLGKSVLDCWQTRSP